MLDRLEQVARQLLGLLDVRLVERVDAEDRAGDRGRDLPAERLGAEVDRVGDLDPDDRVAGRLERVGQGVAAAVGPAGQGEPDERPVGAVGLDRTERLEVDRDDPDAVLAGALGDELLGPGAEARDLVVGQERQLVAARLGEGPDGEPERDARVGRRIGLVAGADHRQRRRQQRVEVDPDERGRHEPDVGQRRVAPADVGRVEEHLAEVVGVGDRARPCPDR